MTEEERLRKRIKNIMDNTRDTIVDYIDEINTDFQLLDCNKSFIARTLETLAEDTEFILNDTTAQIETTLLKDGLRKDSIELLEIENKNLKLSESINKLRGLND